jgi:hypothetical protein
MAEFLGNFTERDMRDAECLELRFSATSIPLRQRWRNNGLSAGFLSDYVICFFPGEDTDSAGRREAAKSAVSYIANELLENAMKFTHAPSEYPVTIGMHLDRNQLRFYVTNSVDAEAEQCLRTTIQRLLTEDTNELFIKQLESSGDRRGSGSGLGYLTMINDYGAELAWKFEPYEGDSRVKKVTTLVKLPI